MKHIERWLSCTALASALVASGQTMPPWSRGANDPAPDKGVQFQVTDVDNVPDLHGDPSGARLVLFIGGNQFFVLPRLIAGFEALHPDLKGHIFYETLPPGILRKQIAAGGTLTLGNLTLQVIPDVYEAGERVLNEMQAKGEVTEVAAYATNTLAIMVAKGNPKKVLSLKDLGQPAIRLSMPNPQWEGVANQITEALRKAGGEPLATAVYQSKLAGGTTRLTEIHHRQTPMRIMAGDADAGVTWASEVIFQEKIGNPLMGIKIPDSQNSTATYAAGIVAGARHKEAAQQWIAYLQTADAQAAYQEFGFRSLPASAKQGRPAE